MKIQSLPKDLLAEVIHYIADYESLDGLRENLAADFTQGAVRGALREVAVQLLTEVEEEKEAGRPEVSAGLLSRESKELLSSLSPLEGKKLLKAFGFLDN
ncbi:MAG: hypothetical protein HYY44_01140 [Deltaproteobacteria bacterium]|nr:hypothetical protein [Deltaproteobacteria bacterium]